MTLPLGLALALLTAGPAPEELRAGAAKVDITPPTGFPMWGYGARHDKPSKGVLDPLHARAVVLASGKDRIAIVSLDLGRAPTRQSTDTIQKRVKAAGIDHVFLVASHTHHGPVIELDNWPTPKGSYVRQLEDKLTGVILDAAKGLRPASLGVAARAVTLNRNRHSRLPDKPVDRELVVVRIEDAKGKPMAHLVNFAAHPTMLSAKQMEFSADFPGVMAALVEKEMGAPCLFLQGACGDLSANPGTESGPQKFGQALGRQVLELAGKIKCTLGKGTTIQVREEQFRFGKRVDLGNPGIRALVSAAFFPALVEFYEREYREGVRPRLTTALLGGKVGLVGVSGEFFSAHALSLKRRARLEHVLFLGYCNDYQQYFPTIEAAGEGGYGADPTVSPVEVGSGERMIDRALIHLYQMRGKLKNFELKQP
ncbi:MAG: neutral/alkaline non-lysosomal ceramidase N-terminal domain-containing protein [Gemmataceae bacterium]|nr:neutral/alkaline non-lysosomal ceramidase N-terminal domain-containing protein [Gemmataceae bacterium]